MLATRLARTGRAKYDRHEAPGMQGLVGELIGDAIEAPGVFAEVAMNDPISAVLLLAGFGFVGFASAVMGYLTLGAAVDFVTPT